MSDQQGGKFQRRRRVGVLAALGAVGVALPAVILMDGAGRALNPVGLWECSGPNCATTPLPDPNNGAIVNRDDSVNVFVGGSFSVTEASAESEGKTVVVGDMLLAKTSGSSRYDVGEAGVGSRVAPNDGEDFLVVGGDVTVNAGLELVAGENVDSVARYGGTLSGDLNTGASGSVIPDSSALSAYSGVASAVSAASTCFAGLSTTGTAVFEFGALTLTGDGSSSLQVFEYAGDIGTTTGNSGISITNVPAGATIIVNLTGSGTKILNTFTGGAGDPLDAFRETLLWNVTEATDVRLQGVAQWQGSVVVANPASTTQVRYPGMNGRFYALGDVVHQGFGTEFHNYPFTGDVPSCEPTSTTTTSTMTTSTTTTSTTTTTTVAPTTTTTTTSPTTTTVAPTTTTTVAAPVTTAPDDFDLSARITVDSTDPSTRTAVFKVTGTNSGSSTVEGPITLTVNLPTGVSFVGVTGTSATVAVDGQVVTLTSTPDLDPGDMVMALIRTRVASGAGEVTASLSVSSADGVSAETNPSNNASSASVVFPTRTLPSTGGGASNSFVAWAVSLLALGTAIVLITRRRLTLR